MNCSGGVVRVVLFRRGCSGGAVLARLFGSGGCCADKRGNRASGPQVQRRMLAAPGTRVVALERRVLTVRIHSVPIGSVCRMSTMRSLPVDRRAHSPVACTGFRVESWRGFPHRNRAADRACLDAHRCNPQRDESMPTADIHTVDPCPADAAFALTFPMHRIASRFSEAISTCVAVACGARVAAAINRANRFRCG